MELVEKLNLLFISEFAMRPFIDPESIPIPDEIWQEYTQSIYKEN